MIEILQLWMPVENGGEAIRGDGQHLKLVALIANGQPIRLEKDFALERLYFTQEELNQKFPKTIIIKHK